MLSEWMCQYMQRAALSGRFQKAISTWSNTPSILPNGKDSKDGIAPIRPYSPTALRVEPADATQVGQEKQRNSSRKFVAKDTARRSAVAGLH